MKLLHAQIQGFRSFQEPVEIEFGEQGLVYLTGRNQVEPSLGANGAGKSTLFEAIYWALFGKTSRGLKASDIRSWGPAKPARVVLGVDNGDENYVLERCWSPNRLLLSCEGETLEVDQQTLEQVLGVSPKTFLHSTFFAQFAPSFLDLKATEQMALFSEVLGLELWEAAADLAGKEGRSLELSIQREREQLSEITGRLIATEAFLEEEGYRAAGQLRTRYHAAVNAKVDLVKSRAQLVLAEKALQAEGTKQSKERRALRERLDEVEEEREKGILQKREWESELRKLEGLKQPSKTCETCGAPLDKKQIEAAMRFFIDRKALKNELTEQVKEASSWLEDFDAERKSLKEALDEIPVTSEAQQQVTTLKAVVANHRTMLDSVIRMAEPKIDPNLEARAKLLRQNRDELKKALSVRDQELEGLRFWQKEFKELRLYLIEESLTQLEVESNSALHELGLTDWRVEFDVEREKKTGGTKTGFSVLIYSPVNEGLVPWEAWSGGESQRLRLAVAMGFASLIESRTGAETNVEFWDEPSNWLSTSGITDLMLALKSRAQNNDKQIWVADHRALDFGGFSKTVVVTKTEAGSSIS